jgi:transcriptional regulator with XRE-family HTH domain
MEESPGARVKRLRQQLGISQSELARRLGVDRQNVYQIERGQQEHMRKHTLQRYAEALGVSPSYLATGRERDCSATLPEIEAYLSETTVLSKQDIQTVVRIVRALEAEQLRMLNEPIAAYDRALPRSEDWPPAEQP